MLIVLAHAGAHAVQLVQRAFHPRCAGRAGHAPIDSSIERTTDDGCSTDDSGLAMGHLHQISAHRKQSPHHQHGDHALQQSDQRIDPQGEHRDGTHGQPGSTA
jgi:hypothetical protein